jgi:ribosomal protein L40E
MRSLAGIILTWVCSKCGWANDNNNGPCRRCGAAQ